MKAAVVYTEMVSCEGVMRRQKRTLDMMLFGDDERPLGVQLFGGNPEHMKIAAEITAREFRPELIDINFGCPVRKVVRRNEGAGILKDLSKAKEIMQAVVEGAGNTPVTVKMRTGWDDKSPVFIEIGLMAQNVGVAALTLHARTQGDLFSGHADWSKIKELKEAVNIPVIGNGDVTTPQEARRMLDETNCDAVMIGRGALGNPFIFQRTHHYIETGELLPEPEISAWIEMARIHAQLVIEEYGESRGSKMMRRYLAWYIKGFPGARALRPKLVQVDSLADINRIFDIYLESVNRLSAEDTDISDN